MIDKDLKYIAIKTKDDELIAYIPLQDDVGTDIINKKDNIVVMGYSEPMFEDIDGKIYLVERNEPPDLKVIKGE